MGLPLITAGELTGSSTPWPRLPLRSHVLPSLVSSFPCTSWLSLPAEWSLLSQPQSPICTMEMTRGPSAWGCTALTPTSHVLCGLGWVAQPLCASVSLSVVAIVVDPLQAAHQEVSWEPGRHCSSPQSCIEWVLPARMGRGGGIL